MPILAREPEPEPAKEPDPEKDPARQPEPEPACVKPLLSLRDLQAQFLHFEVALQAWTEAQFLHEQHQAQAKAWATTRSRIAHGLDYLNSLD